MKSIIKSYSIFNLGGRVINYHYIDAILTFIFMTIAMISGALLIPKRLMKYRRLLLIIHLVSSIISYIMLIITIIRAPRL